MKNKTIYIDDTPHAVLGGESLLTCVRRVQGEEAVPTLCEYSGVKSFGACRVCSVEVALSKGGGRKTMASCHTPAEEGMWVYPNSSGVQSLRKNIIELVVSDHPLDCLTCEVSGNCELQSVAAKVGLGEVRYPKGKNHLDIPKDNSHSYMTSDLSKCISCQRCVRACDEIQGEFVLSMSGRGFESKIIKGMDQSFKDSDCVSCGACAQACPTSAISDVFKSKSVHFERKVRTVCTYCGVGCNLEVAVKSGEVASIQAPQDAEVNGGHTCVKGRYAFSFYKHPDRLRSPLIKKNGQFEEVSWAEVYSFIAKKLLDIKSKHGSDAIAGISSARCTNEENYLMQKMMRVVVGTNNIDCCARVCHSPTALGLQKTFGTGAATNSIEEIYETELVLLIGANPTAAHPVTGAKIRQVVLKGVPSIVIDPRKTELAELATVHLQLKPGSNLAVLNMMSKFILEENEQDEEYIEKHCEDFELYKKEVMSIDVQEMEKVCGVDAKKVRQAAILYARSNRAMSFHGLGVTEHVQGSRTVMAIANLAMMCGHIGKRGVGVNPLRGQNNVQGAADMGAQPHQGAGYLEVEDKASQEIYAKHYGVKMPSVAGLKIPEMFEEAKKKNLKALWIMGEDVAQTDPNCSEVVASLEQLDLLVVQELFMSETAKLATVVLPGTSFFEKDGTFTNGERRVQKVNRVVEPLEGCKTDGDIFIEMMEVLGFEQKQKTATEVLEEISEVVPFFAGINRDRLGEQGLQWPVAKDGSDTKILHRESFKRGKGKFHFYDWVQSPELKNHSKKYPYILTTGRELEHYNCGTMTRRTNNKEILSRDVLLVHEKDATKKGIKGGEKVKLFSARGSVDLDVKISSAIKPGILYTTFHFPEAMVNLVTGDGLDLDAKCPEFKVVAVDFEKS